ncbi:FadR/GntR family transcriptional regulator [Kitasatospora paracochleata]|uniref:DNA-binding FadR family transcriptional regulator n=1 Tax=Kitasatospora paracochleata TaxID=58354 RepID=A0ABT1J277_9ACTN|nr:GntR family transcriptional regulator [Kitasatospora paracochleata]MCP2311233.1 DNA-binding FadR family transcriptional regulator [Kitasatospora paracochleata]
MDQAAQTPMNGQVDAAFRPVRTGNAFEETVERILQAIKLGVLAHGDRLPAERDLATRLGISRETLREALRSLQEAGYVEARRGRYGGTFVTYRLPAPDVDQLRRAAQDLGAELEDALAFRLVLETGAADLAARRELSDDQRAYLLQRLADADGASVEQYRQCDSRFHLAIGELTGSPSLAAAIADARMRLNDLLNAIPMLGRNIDHASHQHHAITHAILGGDPTTARRATEEHLQATATLLRAFLA